MKSSDLMDGLASSRPITSELLLHEYYLFFVVLTPVDHIKNNYSYLPKEERNDITKKVYLLVKAWKGLDLD